MDPIDSYKADVDRSLLRANLKLTPQQRSEKFVRAMRLVFEIKRAATKRKRQRLHAGAKPSGK
jgi:hypothetical protein